MCYPFLFGLGSELKKIRTSNPLILHPLGRST